jgi:hypothetical protein
MKKYLFIFIFCTGLQLYSKPMPHSFVQITSGADSAKKYDFTNNQIKYRGNILGKFTLSETKSEEKGNKETHLFKVIIYGVKGDKAANYDLTILENTKKGLISVVDVSLKTVKDNVKHDGANFINYSPLNSGVNELDKKINMLQLNNLMDYLLSYKYF